MGVTLSALLPQFNRQQTALFGLWLLAMIMVPVARYLWGELALKWGVAASVLLQAGLVLLIVVRAWGVAQTALKAAGAVLLAWAVEAVGTATGVPFGGYNYTNTLQPQVAHVPLLIPIAWLMMLPAAWAVAHRVVGAWRGPLFVAVSALALTAWDLFLDPQMVAWGFWTWTEPGGYFGIPWTNFLGWLLTAVLITVVVRPAPLPAQPLWLIYALVWLLETGGLLFFWGLPGPALAGFMGMGIFVWLAWPGVYPKSQKLGTPLPASQKGK